MIFHAGAPTPDVTAWSVESIDGGAHWTRDPHSIRGDQIGVLTSAPGPDLAAEAWDQSWSDASRQKLRSRYELP